MISINCALKLNFTLIDTIKPEILSFQLEKRLIYLSQSTMKMIENNISYHLYLLFISISD